MFGSVLKNLLTMSFLNGFKRSLKSISKWIEIGVFMTAIHFEIDLKLFLNPYRDAIVNKFLKTNLNITRLDL